MLSIKRTGKDISFLVADDGKGIRKEDLGKLFQPFYTSGKIKGTGLGLAIVKKVVEEHSGTITAGNNIEGGAYFKITLPRGL